MATRSKKSDGSAAPKRTRRSAASTVSSTPELSAPLATAEAADTGAFPATLADRTVDAPATHVDDSQVAQRAYELYEEGGWESGREWEHWFRAESELRGPFRR